MKTIDCELFLMWPAGAGGNFLQSLWTWGSIEDIPIDNNINLFDASPFKSVAQIDNLNDIHSVESSTLISTHNPDDFYLTNYEFKCKEAWAITINDLKTWKYVCNLKDFKRYGQPTNRGTKSQLNRYTSNVNKVANLIDNLQIIDYNEIFVNRTIFPKWSKSIEQYHKKNLMLWT